MFHRGQHSWGFHFTPVYIVYKKNCLSPKAKYQPPAPHAILPLVAQCKPSIYLFSSVYIYPAPSNSGFSGMLTTINEKRNEIHNQKQYSKSNVQVTVSIFLL